MPITKFIEPLDSKAVFHSLCEMLRLFGILSVVPLAASFIAGDFYIGILFCILVAVSFLAGQFLRPRNPPDLGVKEALAVTALSYLLYGLLGAVPFLHVTSFLDGFFEAMSGFTTTGLSVVHVEELPPSLLFFRAYMQWIGGMGIIILSLVALVGPGKSALQLYTSEFGQKNLVADVKATARIVVKVYMLLTVLGYFSYVGAGMGFFDALTNIMATISTGGFSPYSKSIGKYDNPLIDITVIIFMVSGAIAIPSYYLLWRREWKMFSQELQMRYLLGLALVFTVLFSTLRGWNLQSLLKSSFQAATAITTTGFSTSDTAALPDELKLLTAFLMIVGGSAGSTAGGIKLLRLILMVQLIKWFVVRALLPDEAKFSIKFGGADITDTDIKKGFAFLGCYVLFLFVSSSLLSIAGFGAADSFFESASALGTVGLSVGITSHELVYWAKFLLIFNMWAGRLEILPIVVAFYPGIWMPGRRTK